MGCGSSNSVTAPIASKSIYAERTNSAVPPKGGYVYPATPFRFPDNGTVNIASMRYTLKYFPDTKILNTLTNSTDYTISSLSWESFEDSITFNLKDVATATMPSEEFTPINFCAYQWRTTRDGHYVVYIDINRLKH